MMVLFAISLQCSVISSLLSALHTVEHASEIADAHSRQLGHGHELGGAHYHADIHAATHHDGVAAANGSLLVDGHQHGMDPNHATGDHGFYHAGAGAALFAHGFVSLAVGEVQPATPPLAFRKSGASCARLGVPHRPPIA